MYGLGVLIKGLSNNSDSFNAIQSSIGCTIRKVFLDEDNNNLVFWLSNDSELKIWDGGQSCYESRFMTTDDNLNEYFGSVLLGMELKPVGRNSEDEEDNWGDVHEIQFLDINTSKGTFQMANHNCHNGYYGGFYIEASINF